MYSKFLRTIADLSEGLDKLATIGEDSNSGLSTPYLGGKVDVLLEGEPVGHFLFEDEWVIYHDDPNDGCDSGPVSKAAKAVVKEWDDRGDGKVTTKVEDDLRRVVGIPREKFYDDTR